MGKPYKHGSILCFSGSTLNRKTRFLVGVLIVIFLFSLPIAGLATVRAFPYLSLTLVGFVFSIYMVYRVTIKNAKTKYPLVSPEGHPDVYTGRMPRPIYEDTERYPWFFRKKLNKKLDKKKERKKH